MKRYFCLVQCFFLLQPKGLYQEAAFKKKHWILTLYCFLTLLLNSLLPFYLQNLKKKKRMPAEPRKMHWISQRLSHIPFHMLSLFFYIICQSELNFRNSLYYILCLINQNKKYFPILFLNIILKDYFLFWVVSCSLLQDQQVYLTVEPSLQSL